ncbi:MAG: DUF3524 domain-containing protein [Bacteroidota bacterium]
MKILLLEPFFTGSHQQWAEGLQKYSRHQIEILSLPGRHWKWRMHGGAVTLAQVFNKKYKTEKFDLLLVSDMIDLSSFLSLTRRRTSTIPTAIYFHENQLTYPWSPTDRDPKAGRDHHYAFINYTSALSADAIFFNSVYHQKSWLEELPKFLNQFPDFKNLETVKTIENKSQVLHLGMCLKRFDALEKVERENVATLLWNHRWEYDKNPKLFFTTLFRLKKAGVPFRLLVVGESYQKCPPIFSEAKEILKEEIIHFGYAADWASYGRMLWQADILPVSSHQDFFGGSVIEAMYCKSFPILPNRLAYPEHIPPASHTSNLYSTPEEFFQKIKNAINNIERIRSANHFQNFVAQYDWSNLIAKYDNALDKVCQT